MSMSVVAIMSELPRIGSGDRLRRIVNHQDVAKVKRVLFGPIDRTETQKFLERELTQLATRDTDRWEFDFVREVPRPTERRFLWSASIEERRADPCPPKRKYVEEDTSRLYGQPIEEQLRPRPKRIAQNVNNSTQNGKQSVITDYMQVRKRAMTSSKNEVGNNEGIAAKKPRFSQPSTS